jgi:DNA-binding LytR/AlgR family response regulator
MNVLIIEDELPARAKLVQMLQDTNEPITIVGELGSVKDSVTWFKQNALPDVAFVDIQLSDDHSFEVFRQVPVTCPVIFTTAYDKYLLASFEFNSIDYLLKPLTREKLNRTLEKVKTLAHHFNQSRISDLVNSSNHTPRIIGKKGTEFIAIKLPSVAYFYSEHKIVFARDLDGKNLIVDQTITELETILVDHDFFRINRKFLAHYQAIEKFKSVSLSPPMKEVIHVSKETAPQFRKWIEGKTNKS